jgi:hypothetical protein
MSTPLSRPATLETRATSTHEAASVVRIMPRPAAGLGRFFFFALRAITHETLHSYGTQILAVGHF